MVMVLANQGHEVIIIDNASTYPPLLEYYENECPCKVIKLDYNYGHLAPWRVIDIKKEYVVTDPDLDISKIPWDWPDALREGLEMFPKANKCGFSDDFTKIPINNPIWLPDSSWDSDRMTKGRLCKYYDYWIDTGFALYRPGLKFKVGGVRTGRPYTARHLPSCIVLDKDPKDDSIQIPMDDEIFYYFTHANESSSSAQRMGKMLHEYWERHK
jgi:hypothetical protein